MCWLRLALGAVLLCATSGVGQAKERLTIDFRRGLDFPSLSLYGPEARSVSKTEAEGWRVTLPADRVDTNVVGVELSTRIRGDFDVVLTCELLSVGDPPPKLGAGVHLRVKYDTEELLASTVTRLRHQKGQVAGTFRIEPNPDGTEKWLGRDWPMTKSKAKLRIARTGGKVQCSVADGDADFKQLKSDEIGTHDVQSVRVFCSSGWERAAVDVRFIDLAIEADEFPERADAPSPQPVHVPTTSSASSSSQGGLPWGWIMGVGITVALLAGVWLYVRKRRAGKKPVTDSPKPVKVPAAPALRSVQCPGCESSFKAKVELAGKKVRCPKCGKSVLIPGPEEGKAKKRTSERG